MGIKNGKLIEDITTHLARLKAEIDLCGIIGLQNIHKQSENFIARLLNLVYEYKLENLGKTPQFPGLDIGDKNAGVAYQVSSEKGSDKVDETLKKCLKFQHYNTFSDIRIFMLKGKQNSYSLNVSASPYFRFDTDNNIFDFKDLLREIQHLDTPKLQRILNYLEDELSSYIGIIMQKGTSTLGSEEPLINCSDSQQQNNLPYYTHFSFELRLRGITASVAHLYKSLNDFLDNQRKKDFIPIFNNNLRKKGNSQEYLFKFGPSNEGYSNSAIEMALKLTPNTIRYELAIYRSTDLIVSNLNREFDPIILLMFFLEELYKGTNPDLEVDIDINTNAKFTFTPQASNFKASGGMVTYTFDTNSLSHSLVLIKDAGTNLVEMMKVIIDCFSAADSEYGTPFANNIEPFLHLNEKAQQSFFSNLKVSFISITL